MTEYYIWGMTWAGMVSGALVVVLSPALVGKTRDPYTVWEPVKALVRFGLTLPLFGRLLGWW